MLDTAAIWGITGTTVTSFMFIWAIYSQYVPRHLRSYIEKYAYKMIGWVSLYVHIKFNEYTDEGLKRSENYDAIRNYLSTNSAARALRLKADESKNSKALVLSMDDHEEVEDVFDGVKVKWYSNVKEIQTQSSGYGRSSSGERRFFTLTFHRRHRGMIIESYITHVLREGREIGLRNRERKLFTNNSSSEWYAWRSGKWSNVPFHHPATFETLAMDPEKKEGIKKVWRRRRRRQRSWLRKKRRVKQRGKREGERRKRKQRRRRRRRRKRKKIRKLRVLKKIVTFMRAMVPTKKMQGK
ncbi:AAA-ATPase At3g28510-like isoform X2 [Brassica napus]|uniref:AAA-ATPase At3g28510-like isoform X2 n=1 Tax=Brassica napus TaxID=3708 RepID=UPI002078B584|nr:AAA-ATPase At3g28510-like isoform X2 [Brassica napus]